MRTENPPLPMGYSQVPPGKLANAVTCLEMTARPPIAADIPPPPGVTLERMTSPDIAAYRTLYRLIGQDWLWTSRLVMADDRLRATLQDPQVEVWTLSLDGRPAGLLELDFRQDRQCELVFCGLVKDAIGGGIGRYMMERAKALAWSRPIDRFWVHTCHFDHPNALAFYRRAGFVPYGFMVELMDDPRLIGILPRDAAPHVPLLG